MRISDWSSDVCSSDLRGEMPANQLGPLSAARRGLAGHVYRLDRRRWCRGRVSVRLGAVQHRLQTVSALRHHAASASLYRRIVVYSYSRWISSAAGPCGSHSCTAWPAAWARKKAFRLLLEIARWAG